jgi:iron complex transport system ATP-binding protein
LVRQRGEFAANGQDDANGLTIQSIHLTLDRERRIVLRDISLTIAPGEIVGLLGPNGAGKSTLLAAFAGELSPAQGIIKLDAIDLASRTALDLAQRRAVVTQQSNLSFDLSVLEVAQMGAYPFSQALPEQVEQWSQRALTLTELSSLQESLYTTLSGGEQQRVQLARALVQCFAIEHYQGVAYLLLDEPLANLDPRHQIQFMQVLEQLVGTALVGVLIVMHDLNVAARHCDRLILLSDGHAIAQGLPSEVLTPLALKQAFGLDWSVITHPKDANRLLVLT